MTLSASPSILETLGRVTHLGMRFWDSLSDAAITDGLVVTAYSAARPTQRVNGRTNTSGAWFFPHLPGLSALEWGSGDAEYWTSIAAERQAYVVEVGDSLGRFQAFSFVVQAPVQGLATLDCDSTSVGSSNQSGSIPLYSAPTRLVPAAMAVVRAELRDPVANAPAAWAGLEAFVGGVSVARTFADERGRAALIFAFPEPAGVPLGSPGGAGELQQLSWMVTLSATYGPIANVGESPPVLCAVLAQPRATLWAATDRVQALGPVQLSFGQDLVVRSIDSASGAPASVLFITASAPVG
jgi:hypothetical protein